MGSSVMMVAIVFIIVGFSVLYVMYKKHLEFKEKVLDRQFTDEQQNTTLLERINTLETRIEILEKIVTDEGYSVQKEIKNL